MNYFKAAGIGMALSILAFYVAKYKMMQRKAAVAEKENDKRELDSEKVKHKSEMEKALNDKSDLEHLSDAIADGESLRNKRDG